MCEVWRIVEFLLLITLCEMVFLDMLWILRALLGRKRKEIYVLFDKIFLCIMLFFCLRQFLPRLIFGLIPLKVFLDIQLHPLQIKKSQQAKRTGLDYRYGYDDCVRAVSTRIETY